MLKIWLLVLSLLALSACGGNTQAVSPMGAVSVPVKVLPKILIVGDLKSMGWTPIVQQAMRGIADVQHAGTNPQGNLGTTQELDNIDKYLANGPYLIVHLDAESDMASCQPASVQNNIPTYISNLTKIITKIQASGAKPIFSTILPMASNNVDPCHHEELAVQYNEAAVNLMNSLGVQVNDLWSVEEQDIPDYFSLPQYDITAAGNEAAALSVVQSFGYIAY